MKETIFYLEGRGGMWIYHFIIYNLGGLFYIVNELNTINNNCLIQYEDSDSDFEF